MDLVSQIIKFNSQTSGRDKLCRFFQYGSKCSWWYLQKLSTDKTFTEKAKKLENTLSATRKLLRFGKSFEMVQEALTTIHLNDVFLRVTITIAKLNTAVYLLIDHILWAEKVGLLVLLNKKYYRELSAQFWLVTLILNLSRDLYEILESLKKASGYNKSKTDNKSCMPNGMVANGDMLQLQLLHKCLINNPPLALDTMKNAADILLPLSILGFIRISPGQQGILGIISSFIGIMTVWNSALRLRP
ncbi:peroxisomal membrane protein 11B-like [Saccoglossus kowalevskii]|uniref:Peroxisomal membrane protein 11B-like n=1 Tax=Saccoglossus kowalevskii TaxID=10224 RepID=A0ABM0GW23_SACKO|nr:PREDICTED: peroxisomal membrane protein 11B-like [Saccoglossus kowalevskii]